jgi:hypothetical protein
MMAEKLSTNEKLEKFVNSYNDDEDDGIVEQEAKARSKLKKISLYGSGARAQVPKTKRSVDEQVSPFKKAPNMIFSPPASPIAIPLQSSIPPGAHQDMFRIVTNPTSRSRNDPDRIFFTSSTMTEGIVSIPQPAWYCGSNIKPCDNNMDRAANRYGYRGSLNISEYLIHPMGSPVHTLRDATPAFLQENTEISNPYVPKINGAPFGTINNLESPKLWPENTEYTTGYKKKKWPTSPIYIRETTIAQSPTFNPKSSASLAEQPKLLAMIAKEEEDRQTIADRAKKEVLGTYKSLPLLKKSTFESTWDARLKSDATSQLQISMNRTAAPYNPHTLVDPMDELNYSGNTAMIIHTTSNEEMSFRLQMGKNGNSIPYAQRWKCVETTFKSIKLKLKRERTMKIAIDELGEALRKFAMKSGGITSLKRSEFIPLVSEMRDLEAMNKKHFSQLYNVFDPRGNDSMRFVELLACLSIYDAPDANIITKLSTIWKLYEMYGSDLAVLDICFAVLNAFSASDADKNQVEKLFKSQFRPTAYRMSILENQNDSISNVMAQSPIKGPNSASTTPVKPAFSPKKKDLQTPPAYNISENYIDQITFLEVLERCPNITSLLDSFLSARLISLYGNDPRIKVERVEVVEYEPPPSANKFDSNMFSRTSRFS